MSTGMDSSSRTLRSTLPTIRGCTSSPIDLWRQFGAASKHSCRWYTIYRSHCRRLRAITSNRFIVITCTSFYPWFSASNEPCSEVVATKTTASHVTALSAFKESPLPYFRSLPEIYFCWRDFFHLHNSFNTLFIPWKTDPYIQKHYRTVGENPWKRI